MIQAQVKESVDTKVNGSPVARVVSYTAMISKPTMGAARHSYEIVIDVQGKEQQYKIAGNTVEDVVEELAATVTGAFYHTKDVKGDIKNGRAKFFTDCNTICTICTVEADSKRFEGQGRNHNDFFISFANAMLNAYANVARYRQEVKK